ncbi:MAG TPA: nucleoside monophosphate kinase [Phycisphaerales bacterium]|nr:nucleoside monophosphate kinase [Phycisphaerales bacterium]
MANRYQAVLLFGAPGVGKGTQGKILAQIPGFYHFSTGDMFRNLDLSAGIGKEIMAYMSKGELVPDQLTIKLWRENTHARSVLGFYKPHHDILILDGMPRNVKQAEMLEDDINVLAVVHLVCRDKDEMVRRLQRRALKENRQDDAQADVIRRRLHVYEQETAPVLAHYPSDLIYEVDALGSPAYVLQHILEVLVPVQDAHFNNPITGGEPVSTGT